MKVFISVFAIVGVMAGFAVSADTGTTKLKPIPKELQEVVPSQYIEFKPMIINVERKENLTDFGF